MQHARRRPIVVAALLLALLLISSPAQARWSTGDIGFINMERVCRDGALVSIAAQSDGGSDVIGAVGARRHDNLAAAPEPGKAFAGNGTPRPLDDYGPNIVAAPELRDITVTSQSLAREAAVNRGNSAPDIVQKYGVGVLPWSAPQQPGTPVILVYRRGDSLDVGIAEEIVGDCTIGSGNTTTIAASALPGAGSAIPPAQLSYFVAGWPSHGLLLRDSQPLAPGTRFSAADLAGHPLTYATSRTPPRDLLPLGAAGTDLASRISDRPANSFSANNPAISDDGRYVAFESLASTLVSGDTNDAHDIFVYDRQTSQTARVSIDSSGAQADNSSTSAAISSDGRYVAFQSSATNLVAQDANNASDIFVRDRQTGQTSRISIASDGAEAQGASTDPAISADGRYIAFVSDAANLVAGDTGGHRDVFLHDRQTGQTTRVSVGLGGAEANSDSDSPAISSDGSSLVFHSDATNLVTSDTNNAGDIFLYNRQIGQISRVSLTSGGDQAQGESTAPAISADGRAVVFASTAGNLTATNTSGLRNIYLRDRLTNQTIWVSHTLDGSAPDADSDTPTISGDGGAIAFLSTANNLVGYDAKSFQDVFLYDRRSDTLACLSVSAQGGAADSSAASPAISADGHFTAFESYATNLLPNPNPIDTHGDIYVRYRALADIVVGLPYQVYAPLTRR